MGLVLDEPAVPEAVQAAGMGPSRSVTRVLTSPLQRSPEGVNGALLMVSARASATYRLWVDVSPDPDGERWWDYAALLFRGNSEGRALVVFGPQPSKLAETAPLAAGALLAGSIVPPIWRLRLSRADGRLVEAVRVEVAYA